MASLTSESEVYTALGRAVFAVHIPSRPRLYMHFTEVPARSAQSMSRPRPKFKSLKIICTEARQFLECGYAIAWQHKDVHRAMETQEDIAVSYLLEENFDSAEDRFIICLSALEQHDDLSSAARILGRLALLDVSHYKPRRHRSPLARAKAHLNNQLQIYEHLSLASAYYSVPSIYGKSGP